MKNFNEFCEFVNERDLLVDYIQNYISADEIKEVKDFDALTDELENQQAFDHEIIYTYNAMKYLCEGCNFDESLQYAAELCYEVQNLSSELLASIHRQMSAREQWYKLRDEIEDFLYMIQEEENEVLTA